MEPAFIRAFNFVIKPKIEGGLSLDPKDPGNWTGGKEGAGELKGTKYGISARQYPQLDIAGLGHGDAMAIYYRDYWLAYQLDKLPPRLALVLFDSLVNMRPGDAVKCLQRALDVKDDGVLGPITLAAARRADQDAVIPVLLGERALAYTTFKKFPEYGRGWLRRCFYAMQEASR